MVVTTAPYPDRVSHSPATCPLRLGRVPSMGAGQRNWNLVGIALCPAHHRQGGHAVAYHAGPDAWQKLYGTELELLNQTIEELA